MADGKTFTIWYLRYSKADISRPNTPKALKTESRRDILDETMRKFSVVNGFAAVLAETKTGKV